jgi:thiamine-phosphate pyrophosphorylase
MFRAMHGLYAIVDCDFLAKRGVSVTAFFEQVLTARPAAIQLRAKQMGARATLALARPMAQACAACQVPFFVNDRPDLAWLAGSLGAHLGQHDLSLEDARRLTPTLRFGVSTHRLEEVQAALAQRPDYLAFGPVFSTQSKRDHEPVVGLDGLARAAERCRSAGVPLVAIGGIDARRAAQVAAHADAAAVISALLPPGGLAEVGAAARQLHAMLGG